MNLTQRRGLTTFCKYMSESFLYWSDMKAVYTCRCGTSNSC